MSEWTSVKKELPDYDKYVLWLYENGFVIMECIDKDMDNYSIRQFLKGSNNTGTIKYWMHIPKYPKD